MEKQQAPASGPSPDSNFHSPSVDKLPEVAPPNLLPHEASTKSGAAPNFIAGEFSWEEYSDWEERMGWPNLFIDDNMYDYVELYLDHENSLDLQTNSLLPLERDYIFKLVGIIVGTLTKTPASSVTPTLRTIVDMSWQSLRRLGMKLPLLEKLVATSRKPTALFEARKSVEEAMQLWQTSSDDLRSMRKLLVLKVEEVFNNSNDQRALDEFEHMSKLVAAKLKEVENDQNVFNEKKELELDLSDSFWCSFP